MARHKSIDDDLLLDRLTEVFQRFGYEGASLGRISDATGLQRASLYHRFPGGKVAMAEAVLDRSASKVIDDVVAPLRGHGPRHDRLAAMAREIDTFYTGGAMSCLLDSMSFGGSDDSLRQRTEGAMVAWSKAIEQLAREAGLDAETAHNSAVDALIRIQGALVYARVTGDRQPFRRHLEELPEAVLGEQAAA